MDLRHAEAATAESTATARETRIAEGEAALRLLREVDLASNTGRLLAVQTRVRAFLRRLS